MIRWRLIPLIVTAVCLSAIALWGAEAPQSQPANAPGAAPFLAGPRKSLGDGAGIRGRINRMGKPGAMDDDGDKNGGNTLLTDEQIDRLMAFMEKNFPNVHRRLVRIRERDPQEFRRAIQRRARGMLGMMHTAMENPELGDKMIAEQKAMMRVQELKEQFNHAKDPAEKSRLREEIRKEMDAGFEARIDRFRLEVRRLQQRLDQAKQHLAAQEKNKEKWLDDRMSLLLSEQGAAP